MPVPENIKIYHIIHLDRLEAIINEGCLWCDAVVGARQLPGTVIGMNRIKERRLHELTLNSYPNLHVGDCVPFYFCPRSVMLYIMFKGNHSELAYRDGQTNIIHLEADFYQSIKWAEENNLHWVFTLSNAGSRYFEDRNDVTNINDINWDAVNSTNWSNCIEQKQAEFLMEQRFPWSLIQRIGVNSTDAYQSVKRILYNKEHSPNVQVIKDWYYS